MTFLDISRHFSTRRICSTNVEVADGGGGPKRVDQYLECCTNTRQNKCPRAQKVEQIDSAVFITDFILELSKNGRIPCGGTLLLITINFANKVWALCSLKCCFLIAAILYNRHQVVGKRKKKHNLVKNRPKCSYIMYENGKPISVLDPLYLFQKKPRMFMKAMP